MGLCRCQGVLAPERAAPPIRDTGRTGKATTGPATTARAAPPTFEIGAED